MREVPVNCAVECTGEALLQGWCGGTQEDSEQKEMVKFRHEG